MSSTAEDLDKLAKTDLINRLLDLQAENTALSRQLRSSKALASGQHVDPGLLSPKSSNAVGDGRGSSVSPAAARLSTHQGPKKRTYDISLSVMVIENGSALSVPMSAVLDKTYGRLDERDADTPVVSSKFLREADSVATQRFSIGSTSLGQGDGSPSQNLEEEFLTDLEQGGQAGGGRPSVLVGADGQRVGGDDDEEPSPKDPARETASRLAHRAGVTNLNLNSHALFTRDLSLDADALISLQTLRLFNQQFARDCLSPVSSYGNAVYHYVVKTFAVRNGCQHSPDDVEGFGRTLISLCKEVRRHLQSEPRHTSFTSPCYVFGDLHGNFRDLFYFMDNLISFQDLRYTPHRFMFLGDYVDRGEFSVEVVAYLFAMKVLAPEKVLLLRGNHEDTLVSGDISGYGNTSFRAQCHAVFGAGLGEEVWHTASDTFSYLPLTANIDGKIYCTHGGVPRYSGGVDNRMNLLRSEEFPPMLSFFQVPPEETAEHQMYRQIGMDTCWADPAENESKLDEWGFGKNPRGAGVILFGGRAVDDFLDHFGFEYIFRAHQEKSDGLKLSKNARVFTIFSTSAYVGHANGAGVVLVADNKIRLIVKNADTYEDEEDYVD